MQGMLFKPDVWKAKLRVLEEYGEAQTRRVIKPQPTFDDGVWEWKTGRKYGLTSESCNDEPAFREILAEHARYHIGQTYYVKEAYSIRSDNQQTITKREYEELKKLLDLPEIPIKWKSPRFMPEEYARHFITITGIEAERLQSITDREAIAEGIDFSCTQPYSGCGCNRRAFARLWDSINPKYPWASNPWNFAYSFKLADKPTG